MRQIDLLYAALEAVTVQQQRMADVIQSAEHLADLTDGTEDELLRMAFADAGRQLVLNASFDITYAALALPWGHEFVDEVKSHRA